MSRRPHADPSYRLHKQSGQAIVTLTDGLGSRRDVLLGAYGSDESHAEYARVIAAWRANGRRPPATPTTASISVSEVILAYWRYAEGYYRHPDGRPTSEQHCLKAALRPLRELYGHTPSTEFGPLALKAVRQRFVEAGQARGAVNKHVHRIKRCFRWAVAEQLVPASVYHALKELAGIPKGRGQARETEPVRPVPDAFLNTVLPFMPPTVAAMVEVQRLTGMRPGEVCSLRACDLDVSGAVWLYRPAHHKTAWRGKERVIAVGPKAQATLRPLLSLDTQAYLFSPARAEGDRQAARRAARKSKVYPSEVGRKRGRKRRRPGERYAVRLYAQAVERACDQAFPPPADLAQGRAPGGRGREHWETPAEWKARLGPEKWTELLAWRRAHRWHPNQLRHSYATQVRRQFGLEAAQVGLGHSKADVTQVYAERDLTLALKVAAEVG